MFGHRILHRYIMAVFLLCTDTLWLYSYSVEISLWLYSYKVQIHYYCIHIRYISIAAVCLVYINTSWLHVFLHTHYGCILFSTETWWHHKESKTHMVKCVPSQMQSSWGQHGTHLGAVSIRKTVLPGMAIPMLKIRRPNGRLIFNMEIAIRR